MKNFDPGNLTDNVLSQNNANSRSRVFYDGGCPMCRKEISVYQKADTANAIDWVDVSNPQLEAKLPLSRQALLARFHVQRPNGDLISGARGFIELWRQLPKWRWLGFICSTPGMPWVLELSYQGFLKIRPGVQRIFR